MTTYLTWVVRDGDVGGLPEKTHRLCSIVAKSAKAAAQATALRSGPWGDLSVDIGVLRADLLERWSTFTRRYTIVFTRTVKEVRRC